MKKSLAFSIVALLILAQTSIVLAQEPVSPNHSDPFWQAVYWNNTTLSGTPALQRSETNLNYDWGAGSPHASVSADGFSARWSKFVYVSGGTYRFSVTSDDGVRVWVDGALIINQWSDHPATTFTADKSLSQGHHWVVVEYYENQGLAVFKLDWGPAARTIHGWRGEYFNNMTLSGSPALVRDDANILFDWGTGSPAPGVIPADGFSVRWTRTLNLSPGNYRFMITVDDGGRLWVNDHLLIDAWLDQAARTYTGEIYLPGGPVAVKMEYYENTQQAVARLSWDQGTGAPSPGAIVVDDTDPGFVVGGRAASWRTVYEGYGGRLLWTWNNDWQHPNYNWARWTPNLTAGRYEVFVYIPYRFTTTRSATYTVSHSGGLTSRVVNQNAHGDRWVSLGTYWFSGSGNDYVMLTDVTGEPRLTRLIAFDAVQWVPR